MTLDELRALPEAPLFWIGMTPLKTRTDPIAFPDAEGVWWRPVLGPDGTLCRERL